MTGNVSKISQRDYLKKYLSGGSEDKKKKRKKKEKSLGNVPRSKIIDDDVDVSKLQALDDSALDLYELNEDAPQIAGIVDERPVEVQVLDQYKQSQRWKVLSNPDGDGITVSENQKSISTDTIAQLKEGVDPIEVMVDSKVKRPKGIEKSSTNSKINEAVEYQGLSVKRKDGHNSDVSPPRRKHSGDSSARKQGSDSDISPPRKNHASDSEFSRKKRGYDSDISPPRRKYGNDSSPPRRKKSSIISPPRKKRGSDLDVLPPRKKHSKDASPPRRKHDSDFPPSRRKRVSDFDTSPARKKHHKDSSPPQGEFRKMDKTLDGKVAGLQDASKLKEELLQLRRRENEAFEMMDPAISGKGAAAVQRDRKTGLRRNLELERAEQQEKEEIEKKSKDKYNRWGKGLKQGEDQQERLARDLHEMSKPLARYADDVDLDKHLRQQDREGDPMLDYIRKKQKEGSVPGKSVRPVYEGSFPPNRFNIRPGYRWDGVDRSSGYESKWFEQVNARKAVEEEAYKWSTADM